MSSYSKTGFLDNSVSHWLADLRMECYKKNLESFETVKSIVDIKDQELKKLGVTNSKDRAIMLSSLADYTDNPSPVPSQPQPDSSSKSVLRKGSLRKLNLKVFLGSGTSKKNKKARESVSSIAPSLSTSMDFADDAFPYALDKNLPTTPTSPNYVEIPDYKTTSSSSSPGVKAIPNEYVPSPPEMEPFRGRTCTIGVCQPTTSTAPDPYPGRHHLEGVIWRDNYNLNVSGGVSEEDTRSTLSSVHKSHHLSVVSMESGLSFGYDVEINPSVPLESQPWFHGKLSRDDAEALLHDDGDFLVRENTMLVNTFTLSMRWRAHADHTLIQHDEVVNSRNGTTVKYSFDSGAFDSIPELIHHHIKYQIPINNDCKNMLLSPICRPGVKLPFTPPTYIPTSAANTERGERAHSTSTNPSSPASLKSTSDDRTHQQSPVRHPYSPDASRTYRQGSASPGAHHSTSRSNSAQEFAIRETNSSSNLLDSGVERTTVLRNAISPPPNVGSILRSHTMSHTHMNRKSGSGYKRDSIGDYEVMESVSLLGSPHSRRKVIDAGPISPTHSTTSNYSEVKYAELQHARKSLEPTRRNTISGTHNAPPSDIKYAELRFLRQQQQQQQHQLSSATPHPFSTYDTVPPQPTTTSSAARVNNPYQSRAELLAQRFNPDPKYASLQHHHHHHQRINRADSSPHPFNRPSSSHCLPRQVSAPRTMAGISEEVISSSFSNLKVSTLPNPNRASNRQQAYATLQHQQQQTGSRKTESMMGDGKGAGQTEVLNVPKGLPGYDMLVKLHSILNHHSKEELAYHLTRADAVAFLLTPRPGEDKDVWKERVQKTTSSSGLYVGLQTLADSDGSSLWKKLYFRHLSFSQTVALSIVSAGDTIDRVRVLHRFIDLAFMLQSSAYGNLFSFISIMQGLTMPQVAGMTNTWQLLHSTFPEAGHTHGQLQDILTSLSQGVSLYSTDQITVPAVQHLKTAFHFEEPCLPGYAAPSEDQTLLGQHSNLLLGLDGIHTIVKHASRFSYNARKKLEPLQYNVNLMDFFSQDFARGYLHSIGVTSDDQFERRRRFVVLLSALVDRVTSP